MASPPALPAQPNNSLMVGMDCLRLVTEAGGAIGSREVARRLGLTHTRINRLLGTLAFMGLLERDADRRYRPGPALHALAAQSMMASRLLPAALPVLRDLGQDGYTVALGTLWTGKVCYLYHQRNGQSQDEAILGHELWPADQSTIGIALLAAKDGAPEELEAGETPSGSTLLPNQDVNTTVLEARSRGYALLRFSDDVVSIGVAVGHPPVAGIAVSRRHLGGEFLEAVAARLHDAADEIDRRMHAPQHLSR